MSISQAPSFLLQGDMSYSRKADLTFQNIMWNSHERIDIEGASFDHYVYHWLPSCNLELVVWFVPSSQFVSLLLHDNVRSSSSPFRA